jgi:urea transport system substrate-binding protein
MAIDEINEKGGVLGRELGPVVVDPASNWPLFAEKARELVHREHARVVFGGYTSVSRKSMLPRRRLPRASQGPPPQALVRDRSGRRRV